jgi:hypothetical protein
MLTQNREGHETGPGLVGEREDIVLVCTPGLEFSFGSATVWDGSAPTI